MSACSWVLFTMLKPKMMTPPISPRLMRPRRSALGVVPDIRTTSFWPISWASVGAAIVALVARDAAGLALEDAAAGVGATEPATGVAPWPEHATKSNATIRTLATCRINGSTDAC